MIIEQEMESKRVFVGNLFPDVKQEDLMQRFSKFGSVSKVEIKNKKDIDGNITQTFAFIDMGLTESGLSQCINTLANKKWNGYQMTVQQARESFMERLARERNEKEKKARAPLTKKCEVKDEKESRNFENKDVQSRNYTEEKEDFKGFGIKNNSREKYDPLKLFKSKLAGEELPEPMEEVQNNDNIGEIRNGVVRFDNEEAGEDNCLALKKVYHSSSEDEVETKKLTEKKVKKKAKDDIRSKEFKNKMTKRFLEKQKDQPKQVKNTVEKKESTKSKSKYYEDSSDESEDEVKGKTGTDVLKTFQSFSNVWQDSDIDDDDLNTKIPNESETKQSIKSDNSEDDESSSEESEVDMDPKEEVALKDVQALVSDVIMPRYDPTSADHEQFLRSSDSKADEVSESFYKPKNTFFEVKTDLKQVFGCKSTNNSGFSFGFSKDVQTEKVEGEKVHKFGFKVTETPECIMDVDSDGEDLILPKKTEDVASKFGLQLKGKGVPKSEITFFFCEEDPRLGEGLSYFFDTKIDLDQLRDKYNERRPILSEILKKRARNKAKRNDGNKNAFGKFLRKEQGIKLREMTGIKMHLGNS